MDIVNDNLEAGYNDPRISDVFQQITKRPEVLEIAADFSTPFTLVVGRPAEPGETYNMGTETDLAAAYDCLGIRGTTPEQAAEKLASRGYEALWSYEHSEMPYTEVPDEVPTDKVIIGAKFLGPTTVIVHTADADTNTPHDSASRKSSAP
ncbi:MAG: hypothetical protein H0V97_09445 [Actinobacteria bacterium]|nr:hypothetical protein [Actinomycetota bacterium]